MTKPPPLIDSHGRVHTSLRISVTDRCNIRCFYCMPAENVQFRPREELLSYEEIERFASVAARLGINRLRITGGEPLVRNNLAGLIERLSAIAGIDDIALTTNGVLLAEQATELKNAGLQRLNISLDTLDDGVFFKLSRRRGIDRIIAGIHHANKLGFKKIRLNAIAIKSITEQEIVPLTKFARQHDLELRFIEFMPLDADDQWQRQQVLTGDEIKAILETSFCKLLPVARDDGSQPAVDFQFADGQGRIGFINPLSQPFCHNCNRIRITAEGQLRNCLFSTTEWDVRELLRNKATAAELEALIRSCVSGKNAAHGIDSDTFIKPQRAMYQIGG
ncbi:MAG: GTP 3',8-cyclase MoaA [Planctomycetaceae bacterium]|jgi:GTP 3',8-cyclase|nr:GTP 3',8-cyclase MoaA [Planctomycetaceae bacterium]